MLTPVSLPPLLFLECVILIRAVYEGSLPRLNIGVFPGKKEAPMNIFSTNYGRDHLPCFHVHFSSTSSTHLSLYSLLSINYPIYTQLQICRRPAATSPQPTIETD